MADAQLLAELYDAGVPATDGAGLPAALDGAAAGDNRERGQVRADGSVLGHWDGGRKTL